MRKFYNFKKKYFDFSSALNLIGNIFFCYCIIIASALIIFSLMTIECEVTGSSMQPTLNRKGGNKSDIAYVNKLDHDYEYGDIVVIDLVDVIGYVVSDEIVIKRVVGLPGDVIDIVNVDGQYKLSVSLLNDYE